MKRAGFIILSICFCCGCAKVQHLDQLLTLKGLADEQDAMGKEVAAQDARFEMMLGEFKAGSLHQYTTKNIVRKKFGDPIMIKQVKRGDDDLESWLYRYSTKFFNSEKLYLFFDVNNNLVDAEYKEAPKEEEPDGEVE